MPPFSLVNKTILIVGASSGIGRAIAVACARMGAEIILTSRNKDKLLETNQLLAGGSHRIIEADITSESDRDILIDELPKLDGIVLSAGINKRTPVAFLKPKDFENILSTNFSGSVWLIKKLLSRKKIAISASIVIISSIAVTNSSIGDAVYSATKGALNAFSKVLALEVAPKNIRVNCLRPGMIRTNLIASGPLTTEDLELDEQKYPLKRYGKPEDVAYAAVFLLSDESSWMTGSDIVIDGGRTLV